MLISYKWLQGYFEEKLPAPERLAELITFGFAEVESIETIDADKRGLSDTQINADKKDTILDVKVLPDRACYALSHRGVAYEVAAITGLKKKTMDWPQPEVKKVRALAVRVEAPELCSRYIARRVLNITQKGNPWVKEHLEAVGQRLINPIVDGANLVMFDCGQPLHAFDADKVEGGIVVRLARKGEKITTLDNSELILDEGVLIIADEKSPLAIAGIKGGTKAAVTDATKNLILESANFDASYIRKASERLGIKTDASKRFENRFSASLAGKGMTDFSALLFEMDKKASFGEIVDWYPNKLEAPKLKVEKEFLVNKLGIDVSDSQIEEIFSRLLISFEKENDGWLVTPPAFRVDLAIPEDIAEEVGRIIGYDKIPAELPPKTTGAVEIPKQFYYEWKVREALVSAGFSEVMTASFSASGDVAIEKPLAEDKKFARPTLRGGFAATLKMNALNAPLFGADEVRIFEIGRIFEKKGEHTALALGYTSPKKKIVKEIESTVAFLEKMLGTKLNGVTKDGVFECIPEILQGPTLYTRSDLVKAWDISIPPAQAKKFKPFSLYPLIVRDVALFVPADVAPESVAKIIKENVGELVVHGPELFDEFAKEGKKSLAFRLVFQSFDRTLTDDEVNAVMEKVYAVLKGKGWTVR